MKHGSLFSGIGGIDLGFERRGIETIWTCEIEDYPHSILQKRFPDAVHYRDVRNIDESVEKPDIISGGFPCQDISIAGKGAGIDGERSGLWAEMFRIIGLLRPKYTLIENVPMLVHRGLSRVLSDLASIGYDAEWQIISAKDVGAWHLRKRIFIVSYTDNTGLEKQWLGITNGKKQPAVKCLRENVSDSESVGQRGRSMRNYSRDKPENIQARNKGWGKTFKYLREWKTEPGVGRVAHGISRRVDRLKCLGNAVVPQVAELIGKYIVRVD